MRRGSVAVGGDEVELNQLFFEFGSGDCFFKRFLEFQLDGLGQAGGRLHGLECRELESRHGFGAFCGETEDLFTEPRRAGQGIAKVQQPWKTAGDMRVIGQLSDQAVFQRMVVLAFVLGEE